MPLAKVNIKLHWKHLLEQSRLNHGWQSQQIQVLQDGFAVECHIQ
jgi:hypothetical protein